MSIIGRIKNNRTILHGGLFSLFSFVNDGVAFLLLILLANYIAPAEYGRLSLFNTIVQFLGYFVALSTQSYISVSYFRRSQEEFRQDFSSICSICLVITGLFCLVNLALGRWIAERAELPEVFIWFAITVAFFQVFQGMWLNYHRIKEEIVAYGFISCGFALLNFALTLLLVIKTRLSWEGRVYAQLACTVLFGVAGIVFFGNKKLYTSHVTWPNVKMISLWGLPLIPHLASLWIKQGGDRFIINHFHSLDDVGVFSFALNLTSVIIMIGIAFNNSNSVAIYKVLSENSTVTEKRRKLKKQTRLIALIVTLSTLVIVGGACAFIPIILPQYSASISYFVILSVMGLGQCFYFLFCNYLYYYSKNKQLMFVTFFTSLFHLVLSLWLTRYSLYITCVIYVVTQTIVTGLVYVISRKLLKENLVDDKGEAGAISETV